MKLSIILGVLCSAACVFAGSYDHEPEYKADPPGYEPEPPKVYEQEPVKVYEPDYKPEPPKDYKPDSPSKPYNPYTHQGQPTYTVPAVPEYEAPEVPEYESPAPPQVPAYGWPYGPYFPYYLLAGANPGNIGSVAGSRIPAPTVNRPAVQATSPTRPGVAPAGPGADITFAGTGAAEFQGVGTGGFAGTGVSQFNGQFPFGIFGGVGQAQFDGSGRINVFGNQGLSVGTFQNFDGQAGFAGTGFAAAQGAGTFAGAGQGVAFFSGPEVTGNIAGDGITTIASRTGRSYNLAPYGYRSSGYGSYGGFGGYGGFGYRSASPALYSFYRPNYYNAPRYLRY